MFASIVEFKAYTGSIGCCGIVVFATEGIVTLKAVLTLGADFGIGSGAVLFFIGLTIFGVVS